MKILDGLLVVSLEQAVAAPFCSLRLAEAGARVIKIERAEGDFARYYDKDVKGNSAYFVWLNRGKESLVINIKDTNDMELLKNIISSADVYIQNLAPGATERAGLGSKEMRALNKKLITCDISGYGQSGPYRDMKAYDLLVQAETGLCSVTGIEEEEGRVGVSVCDIACGMNAHASILQALYNREKTGKGMGIEVSLFDGMADWMNVPYLQTVYGKRSVKRVGLSHPSIAPYGAFKSKCGKKILISIQNEREWIQLCSSVLMLKHLAEDERFKKPTDRVKNRKELDQIISKEFLKFDKDILLKRLRDSKIACGILNSIEDLDKHPQLRKVKCLVGNDEIELIASPSIIIGEENYIGEVPEIGHNSKEIRIEFNGK
ncbi:MAG: carnitine dehydratase [Pelagibacterales bacterium]|nr:carnitine dehydratase [Pelagibacterales bacterium]PPR15838.1 MAG: Acetyl-CoA:oxalate CoA-transferase [Alphaproteobacteria bacterium MarineAlpha9_Bin3]